MEGSFFMPNEFELRVTWFFRLVARGSSAEKLANSVDYVARSIAKALIYLCIAISLNLIFTNWTAWNILFPRHWPFSLEQTIKKSVGTNEKGQIIARSGCLDEPRTSEENLRLGVADVVPD
jgi:hypothetical protein